MNSLKWAHFQYVLPFLYDIFYFVNNIIDRIKIGYLDDVTIGGSLGGVIDDVERVRQEALLIGLELNPSKCEVIGFPDVAGDLVFDGFARVMLDDAELLGSPLARGSRQNAISGGKVHRIRESNVSVEPYKFALCFFNHQ